MDYIPMFAIAAAGGLGLLAIQHPRQYQELASVLGVVLGALLVFSTGVFFGIEFLEMEVRYDIPSGKRDEALVNVEKWGRRWGWALPSLFAALVYVGALAGISESIRKDRDRGLNAEQKEESKDEVSEGD